MTEGGTPAVDTFATEADVVARWRPFRDSVEQGVAVERLADASALLRLTIPDLVTRAGSNPDLARVAKSLVVEVVRRYLRNPDGAKQMQQTIGPRSYGLTFDGEKPSGVFFTEDELKPLQPKPEDDTTSASSTIGTVFVTTRPGWGPREDHPNYGAWWIGG